MREFVNRMILEFAGFLENEYCGEKRHECDTTGEIQPVAGIKPE